jgi:hypothetical protein
MYSQRDEEAIILRELAGEPGNLLDVGAFDGRTFSNTLALIERGWRALLVEASPFAFIKLMEEHKGRPGQVVLVNALVSVGDDTIIADDLVPFHLTHGDAISTTQQANLEKWSSYTTFQPVLMPTVQIERLAFAPHCMLTETWDSHSFDFINIDVEGESVPIFARLLDLLTAWPARLYCVEYDHHESRVRELCNQHGYEVIHKTDENLICRRRS